jgi:putative phosphoesterase
MKIGIISDAHGNHIGLSSCLDFLKRNGAKKIFFLGDAVGYIVNPNTILSLLQANNCQCLLGNHDAMLLKQISTISSKEKIYKINASRRKMQGKYRSYMSKWAPFLIKKLNGKKMLFVHGSPYNPLQGYAYPDTDMSSWSGLPYDFIFMGHSHYPFIKKAGRLTIVNVGSCGLPRDIGNSVSCGMYDTNTGKASIVRILIDKKEVIDQLGSSMHPSVKRGLGR